MVLTKENKQWFEWLTLNKSNENRKRNVISERTISLVYSYLFFLLCFCLFIFLYFFFNFFFFGKETLFSFEKMRMRTAHKFFFKSSDFIYNIFKNVIKWKLTKRRASELHCFETMKWKEIKNKIINIKYLNK